MAFRSSLGSLAASFVLAQVMTQVAFGAAYAAEAAALFTSALATGAVAKGHGVEYVVGGGIAIALVLNAAPAVLAPTVITWLFARRASTEAPRPLLSALAGLAAYVVMEVYLVKSDPMLAFFWPFQAAAVAATATVVFVAMNGLSRPR